MAGGIVHFEIGAADLERAQQFYGALFDWTFEEYGGPSEYVVVRTEEGFAGGGLYSSESPGGNPIVYFEVADLDASLAHVQELGGEPGEKKPVPGMGWYAACTDTEGNSFSLWQTDPSSQ